MKGVEVLHAADRSRLMFIGDERASTLSVWRWREAEDEGLQQAAWMELCHVGSESCKTLFICSVLTNWVKTVQDLIPALRL